jgi:non-ribosomal peptide synthetase component F
MGLLKAGKIFVPFDPSFPEARLAALLEQCRAPFYHRAARGWRKCDRRAGHGFELEALDGALSTWPGLQAGPIPPPDPHRSVTGQPQRRRYRGSEAQLAWAHDVPRSAPRTSPDLGPVERQSSAHPRAPRFQRGRPC